MPAPSFDDATLDAELEKYCYRHGEGYRDVIAAALQRATQFPRFNPASFNFDRYVAAVCFEASFHPTVATRGPCSRP